MERSSTQQTYIEASVERVWELVGDPSRHPNWWPDILEVECSELYQGCRYRGVIKGVFGTEERELQVQRLDGLSDISIFCDGTGVTTRFLLTEAQGGTFVEGYFAIEPNSLGMKAFGALAGRRVMRSWLERSLENLKQAAERAQMAPA